MDRRDFLTASSLLLASSHAHSQFSQLPTQDEKVVLITGGTSGIGESTVRYLCDRGFKVAFCGRRAHLGSKIEKEVKAKGNAGVFYYRCDVKDQNQVNAFVDSTITRFKKIDVAFLNAAIAPAPKMLHEVDQIVARDIFETNFWGSHHFVSKLLPQFIKSSNGIFIFNSSFGVRTAIPGESMYAASKLAVEALVKHIAKDYAKNNIRSYSLQPLSVRTPMLERRARSLNLKVEEIGSKVLGRLIEPNEIAEVVHNLIKLQTPVISGSSIALGAGAF